MHPDRADRGGRPAECPRMLGRMLELAMTLRKRRFARGALQLSMPEVEVELGNQGEVVGAHLAKDDESHQVIEEFMLAANEAVAEFLTGRGIDFLRRGHDDPRARRSSATSPSSPGASATSSTARRAASSCSGCSTSRPSSPSGTPSTTACSGA